MQKKHFYHLSQAFCWDADWSLHKKVRSCATWGKSLDRFVVRALGEFGADLSYKLPSRWKKPSQTNLVFLEAPECLIEISVPLCRGRGERMEGENRRYWKLGKKIWFLHKVAASWWAPWKGNNWQHPLPLAAGADTISHWGHCGVYWSWHGLL